MNGQYLNIVIIHIMFVRNVQIFLISCRTEKVDAGECVEPLAFTLNNVFPIFISAHGTLNTIYCVYLCCVTVKVIVNVCTDVSLVRL